MPCLKIQTVILFSPIIDIIFHVFVKKKSLTAKTANNMVKLCKCTNKLVSDYLPFFLNDMLCLLPVIIQQSNVHIVFITYALHFT